MRCFGTYINWARDIFYIGDQTGHLHNTEFLKTIELAGGLGKVKNLAVHEDVWAETRDRHDNQSQEFKRYGPVGVVHQLGVERLTIVGKAGFFRDGTEFYSEVDERGWLWNSNTGADEAAEYEGQMERLSEVESDSEEEEGSGDEEATKMQARSELLARTPNPHPPSVKQPSRDRLHASTYYILKRTHLL